MSKPKMRCYYEVLGVSRTASEDDLKKVYRQMALKMHPDKVVHRGVDPEEAKEAFQELQQAYEVLSDPQERAWYDAHREAILQHGGIGESADVDIGGVDLYPYFTSSCFKGFDDDDNGFYKVYQKLFQTICEEDQSYSDEVLRYPDFGHKDSEDEVWKEFYGFFMAYCTPRSYSWVDKYDTRQAENRRVARLMEKENKKIRDAAKKERNELVRELVKWVKRRDKRVQAYNIKLEEIAAENAKKTEAKRLQHLEERAKMLEQVQDRFGMSEMEQELQNLENNYVSDEEVEENYCVACNKQLRNAKAYANHLKQTKHLENVRILKELMKEQDDEALNLDDFGLEDDIDNRPEADEDVNETVDEPEPEQVQEVIEERDKKSKKKKKTMTKSEPDDANVDNIIGAEEKKESDAEPELPKIGKAKLKKMKKAAKAADPNSKAPDTTPKSCVKCGANFNSKNKLFHHLKSTGHATYIGQ